MNIVEFRDELSDAGDCVVSPTLMVIMDGEVVREAAMPVLPPGTTVRGHMSSVLLVAASLAVIAVYVAIPLAVVARNLVSDVSVDLAFAWIVVAMVGTTIVKILRRTAIGHVAAIEQFEPKIQNEERVA